ncbi:Protein FAR1-RELATED SEQUENCE 3 [Linum grandiflorum]
MKMEGCDASAITWFFCDKSNNNSGFFLEKELDSEEQIANIFWADAKMRVDFQCFGDSISFDITYRTNDTTRPLAIFVGKNNHYHLIVFGAALLYDETVLTLKWLFNIFTRCMNSKKPKCIFTYHCAAIRVGLHTVFPNSFHGLCTFHKLLNAHKNVDSLCTVKF